MVFDGGSMCRDLVPGEVECRVECLPELAPVKKFFVKDLERVYSELSLGNRWAWCCVKVTVSWHGFTGEDYLCGCSYADEAEFRADSHAFDCMRANALRRLNEVLATLPREERPIDRRGSLRESLRVCVDREEAMRAECPLCGAPVGTCTGTEKGEFVAVYACETVIAVKGGDIGYVSKTPACHNGTWKILVDG
jgi:hypothetical protein